MIGGRSRFGLDPAGPAVRLRGPGGSRDGPGAKGRWRIDRGQQRYFRGRIAAAEARIAAGLEAGRLDGTQTAGMRRALAGVREGVAENVRDRGFLSAAESSNYRSTMDRIDGRLR